LKLLKEPPFSSIYHLAVAPVRDLWKICNLTLSSIKELDEHHKWYVMMCVEGSSPGLPSNFGMSDGSFDGIVGHEGSWEIGSFVNHDKYGKSSIARNGNGVNGDWEGGEVYVVPDGPCGPPMLVLLEGWEMVGE
jgi:hypothetical protein